MKSIIGVVRVPVVDLLCLSSEWRRAFSYPELTRDDWKSIVEMRTSSSIVNGDTRASEQFDDGQRGVILCASRCMKLARKMSFYEFLEQRMIDEAKKYHEAGISHLLLDFSSVECLDETAVYWMARCLAESFRDACNGDFTIGLKTDNDNWSADIASRLGYDAVFCIDSCNYSHVTALRNRMTDGTGKKQPRFFKYIYNVSQIEEYCCPEGVVLVTDGDEDKVDELGKALKRFNDAFSVHVPLVGYYNDEIVRGENHYDMTEWGARDYIMIDKEVRKGKFRNGNIDESLFEICQEISKFN